MLGFKSARGRAIIAGVVLVILLAGVATVAVWRAYDDQQRNHALEHTSAVATALEHVQGQFWEAQAELSALILLDDQSLVDDYHDTVALLEQNLSQARTQTLAEGEADQLPALDDLTERIGHFIEQIDLALPVVLEADTETRVQLVASSMPGTVSEAEAIIADLEALVDEEQQELANTRAAADRAADTTLWLLVGFSVAAFVVAIGTIAMLIVSLVRPLAALRAGARAITSGDPEARARVSGPEEVASLARDFNAMTDALAAKTQEYIDTTNLTGDIIAKLDKHGRWAFLNDAACRFYGKPRDELLGTDSRAFAHPDDLKSTAQRIRETSAGKELHKGFVNRQVTPMGTRVVEWNGYPIFDEEGEYAGIQITGRDISERKRIEEALRTKDFAIEASINGIALADLEGNITYVNPSLLKMWGYDDDSEMVGKHVTEFWQAEEKAREVGGALRNRESWIGELVAVRKDGSTFDVQLSATSVTDAAGKPICIMGSFVDITKRKLAEEALRKSEGRYRLLAENATDVIWTMDTNLRFTYVSPSITRMTGYTVEEAKARTLEECLTPTSLKVVMKAVADEWAIEETEDKDLNRLRALELEEIRKDGSTIWTELRMTSLRDKDNRLVGILGVSRDITERKRAEEERERLHAELEVRAITDSLTGLYNHAHFYQRLAEDIERSKRYNHGFAVVMMDVDAFKHYNDSRGHQGGDEALRLVGDCIRSAIRRSDLAFRYGGDEFAAILLRADSSRARAVVNRMNRRIAARLKENDDPAAAWLGISAGVACFPEDATTADELVRMADAALYNAKRLAWARGVTEQGQAIESSAFPRGLVHETQSRMLSTAAGSLTVVLEDLGASEIVPELDLRTVAAVAAAAEIKDPYIRDHQQRVSQWAAALADEMGLPPEQVQDIRVAGLLHDLGKVSISEHILNKPGKLTEEEYAKIKEHAPLGAMIVAHVEGLQRLVKIVRHHHERFDGKGYPDGLAGEDIPLEARILAVADVFDAMTHERSYRKALSREEAIAELERAAGTQFDPAAVKASLALLKKRGDQLACPVHAASKAKPLATAKAGGRGKG